MGYKVKGALKKGKSVIIMMIILWIVLSIVLIVPGSISVVDSKQNGIFNFGDFLENTMSNLNSLDKNFSKVFNKEYISTFLKGELYLAIGLLIASTIGLIKTMPKHEYSDIEHGSSDWASGEQYKILSPRKGILLAEKHYLPVDKRGNVNVLVVGRFRFW